MTATATAATSQLVYLLDDAFEGGDWHSLLGNLRSVTPEDWLWIPPGGHRTIRDLVQHVGGCKLMYHDHAFAGATLTWDDPLVEGTGTLADVTSAIAWLRAGHERLRRAVAALNDAELPRPRMSNWGEPKETRWIIVAMLEHDLYHAGEINHLRSLHHGADHWAYETGEG